MQVQTCLKFTGLTASNYAINVIAKKNVFLNQNIPEFEVYKSK